MLQFVILHFCEMNHAAFYVLCLVGLLSVYPVLIIMTYGIKISRYNILDYNTLNGITQKSGSQKSTRIFCYIVHHPKNKDRAKAVLDTWVKRCSGYAFVSTKTRDGSPTVTINATEARIHLWAKVQAAIRDAYYAQIDKYDWFLKTDDDTYVIMENLEHFLSNHSAEEPVYFGAEFKHPPTGGFLSGGAGYVLSKTAIKLLVEKGFSNRTCDLSDNEVEEIKLEECAAKVGIIRDGNTLDSHRRGRFFPYSPERHMTPGNEDLGGWLTHRLGNYLGCCSDSAISFHYISPLTMYIFEYLIYVLKPQKSVQDLNHDKG